MNEPTLRSRTCNLWAENNPDLDTSPMEVVAQLKRITALLELAVEPVYRTANLSVSEVELLVPLRYSEAPTTAIRLAERLGMSRAGVSKALARLEKRGLVSRTSNPEDRRSALISMTAQGKKVVDDVFPLELAAHGELFTQLGRDRGKVLSALEQLAVSMEYGLDQLQGK